MLPIWWFKGWALNVFLWLCRMGFTLNLPDAWQRQGSRRRCKRTKIESSSSAQFCSSDERSIWIRLLSRILPMQKYHNGNDFDVAKGGACRNDAEALSDTMTLAQTKRRFLSRVHKHSRTNETMGGTAVSSRLNLTFAEIWPSTSTHHKASGPWY